MERHPIAEVVFSALEDGEDGARLAAEGAHEIQSAILASIDQGTLRAAVDELMRIAGYLSNRASKSAAESLVELVHRLIPVLEMEAVKRGVNRDDQRKKAEALLGAGPVKSAIKREGEKPSNPWWALRANDDKK